MKKKLNWTLMSAVVTCILALLFMTIALLRPVEKETVTFTPPPFETNAVQGTPEVSEELGWGELDAQVYKTGVCGEIKVLEDHADIWFSNPSENEVWMKLRVTDESNNILGETGLLRPGEYVQQIQFEVIPEAGQAICLKIMAYEPETYHSAGVVSLNTKVVK